MLRFTLFQMLDSTLGHLHALVRHYAHKSGVRAGVYPDPQAIVLPGEDAPTAVYDNFPADLEPPRQNAMMHGRVHLVENPSIEDTFPEGYGDMNPFPGEDV